MRRGKKQKKDDDKNSHKSTCIIIDGDNFEHNFPPDLYVSDLRVFIGNFLSVIDKLSGMKNRCGEYVNPVSYVVSEKVSEYEKKEQKRILDSLRRDFGDILDIFILEPKTKNDEELVSGTDPKIGSLIDMALYDSNISKILIFSGDGDFITTLETTGTSGKDIVFVGIRGTISHKIFDFVGGSDNRHIYQIDEKGRINGKGVHGIRHVKKKHGS